jgi:dihydroxyacetone kinase-like protein
MKPFMNDPDTLVDEMLEAFLDVHGDRVTSVAPRVLVTKVRQEGKVGLVTGGGSGHKPAFIGYLGRGLLDAVVVGDVFTSPPAAAILAAIRAVDNGAGVVLLLGNYSGDVMNFRMAADLARREHRGVELSIATDDIGAGFRDRPDMRRGVVGQLFVWKVAGAAAANGATSAEVVRIAGRMNDATRTIGVAAGPCNVPALGGPIFEIADDELEYGVGHHGERGITTIPMATIDSVVDRMVDEILDDLPHQPGDQVATIINGLGAMPLIQLYIAHRRLHQRLDQAGLAVRHMYVGEFFTALDMPGFSVTVGRLDQELGPLIQAPCDGVLFQQSTR